jgi:hypothetical protein
MKKLGLAAIAFVLTVACSQESKNTFPQGTWKVVEAQTIKGDSIRTTFPTHWQGEMIKIWSEDYFIYIGKWKNSNEEMDIAGGGTYTFNDKQSTEYLDYCESSHYIGKELKLNLDLKNDTLYQS